MAAIFRKDSALVNDEAEASRIHNKGCYGEPQSGGSLKLNLLEALYLFESERLSITTQAGSEMTFGDLITYASRRIRNFEVRYIVYSEMRRSGVVVNLADDDSGMDFTLYRRGDTPKNSSPDSYVIALSERELFDASALLSAGRGVEGTGKHLVLSVVDEEGDITHYRVKLEEPESRSREHLSGQYSGILLSDRVVVPDSEQADKLRQTGFYGNRLGSGLQLSLIEAVHLMGKKSLRLTSAKTGRSVPLNSVIELCSRIDQSFQEKMAVYEDLKERGFIVKTGFKYGSHFRAYDDDPEKAHARYLVRALPSGYVSTWPEISGSVRLAHGVRKEILFALVRGDGVDYIGLRRYIL
ncbi:MAG: tRNA-intron lyase [Thermoplasmata archaeon]|uniref:tRNA-intron lyase n=1 Tax=Candidatus Sysuiplasma superficiale TaxID=2823368 RepID=A0A8J8CBA2_9ARCH|nr:tRNA-intron lyase [Candidatus Sysuiplasma superficiale]MBX8643708.1 tRNA-intron lyase [Candidatus Sysuiplasma superficiale]MCL4347011.1 tRNA-intron lyase [Candidatus Thermoplasmatota archaeon]MCL5437273.1 tRNA-intron lyase [Candidatus Thermoplasmatota archaeon]